MKQKKLVCVFLIIGSIIIITNSCKRKVDEIIIPEETSSLPSGTTFIPPSTQRPAGNATLGEDFIKNGNFAYAGIPTPQFPVSSTVNELGRTGKNATLPFDYTEVVSFNGINVVAPNCLSCHATYLDNNFILGLGNTTTDYTSDPSVNIPTLDSYISFSYGGTQSPQFKAYQPFSNGIKALGPHVLTKTRGVNPADKYALILSAYRNKNDLTWQGTPSSPIPADVVPLDVPAWWLLKKKNALYYNANGQGDFARDIMAAALLTLKDSSYARTIDNHFVDVLAYIKSINAPIYTHTINTTDADDGKQIFNSNCAKCHGTYGANETYPNLLVDLNTIKTDPLLANAQIAASVYTNWYNQSWFGVGANAGLIAPQNGYIAPPLDGVWATAPYLHNGSVPDLATLLNSTQRPKYWTRTFATTDYNFTNVGWNYTNLTSPTSTCYNSDLSGYRNTGHTFGDFLSTTNRMKLIEYLKTL